MHSNKMVGLHIRKLEKMLSVVALTLKRDFPNDFDKRCMYAVFGIHALLLDEGIESQPVGGRFAAFVVSHDGQRAGFQGFGNNKTHCSHYWIETIDRLIDLGPYFLPYGSSFKISPMPGIAWSKEEKLPDFLRYQTEQKFQADVEFSSDPEFRRRCSDFIDNCRRRLGKKASSQRFPTWVATGDTSLKMALRKRDPWVISAQRFSAEYGPEHAPF